MRIGFDMDGVLADFASAYREIEDRLFGPTAHARPGEPPATPATDEEAEHTRAEEDDSPEDPGIEAENGVRDAKGLRRRRDLVWQAIKSTPDFWLTLKPTEEGAVRRIHALAIQHRWEICCARSAPRPARHGARQTRSSRGFDLPTCSSSTARAAPQARRLDYRVDDGAGCIDVMSNHPQKRSAGMTKVLRRQAPGLGAPRRSAGADGPRSHRIHAQPKLFDRFATLVGWR